MLCFMLVPNTHRMQLDINVLLCYYIAHEQIIMVEFQINLPQPSDTGFFRLTVDLSALQSTLSTAFLSRFLRGRKK